MKCHICKHGQTAAGKITLTLERQGVAIVFRDVPAQVCQTCGEQYVDEATTSRLLSAADASARAGVQIEVRSYAAA